MFCLCQTLCQEHTLQAIMKMIILMKFFNYELEEMDMPDDLAVSEMSLQKIRHTISQDQTLQSVKMLLHQGWPEERSKSPLCTHPFWNNRDELTIQNRILFKGIKVVIRGGNSLSIET